MGLQTLFCKSGRVCVHRVQGPRKFQGVSTLEDVIVCTKSPPPTSPPYLPPPYPPPTPPLPPPPTSPPPTSPPYLRLASLDAGASPRTPLK